MRMVIMLTGLALATAAVRAAEPFGAPADKPPQGTIAFSSLARRGWDLYVADL